MNRFRVELKVFFILFLRLSHLFFLLVKKVFARKTILFVSKNQIKTFSIGAPLQIVIVLFFLWSGNLLIQLLRYDSIIREKTYEISNLKEVNQRFEKEVDSLSNNLEKINGYFTSTVNTAKPVVDGSDSDGEKKKQLIKTRFREIFGSLDLNRSDRKVALRIAESNLILSDIRNFARVRIRDLEDKISITGIDVGSRKVSLSQRKGYDDSYDKQAVEVSLNGSVDLKSKQGGPFRQFNKSLFNGIISTKADNPTVNIEDEIEHLANLEKFIRNAPLSRPMKDYYVSSGFGARVDPIRGVRAVHQGMDFVGKDGERVLSPSAGRVIFAGKFGAYGNGIVIDHGYNITTRYGHLSSFRVSEGDYVKKGQIIALQGNTGRSTGSHLHYEVRYKNVPLNPKKFLQAGQKIFNNNSELPNNVSI